MVYTSKCEGEVRMNKFGLEFEETVVHCHQFEIETSLDYGELDGVLDEIQDECATYSDIVMALQERGITITKRVQGDYNGSCELECTYVYEV